MANLIVVGAQWGDEGKGKIVDLLTGHFDIVARYQGGHNAGHTVIINGKKYVKGDYVDGHYLIENITAEGALLSYEGERAILRP